MKQYTVYLKNPVEEKIPNSIWDEENQSWIKHYDTRMRDCFTFYDLPSAKKYIKENIDNYKGSCITKIYSNGDWENCGEIKLKGSNAIRMSNMTTYQY